MKSSGEKFVDYLVGLRDRKDRAALAALRRGLGKPPGTVMAMFPYVIPHAPENETDQRAYFLLAALFAWYPDAPPMKENLGASFRKLAGKMEGDGAQRRFVALLRAEVDELPTHLRHAVGLLMAHNIPLSWEQLLHDIIYWDAAKHAVHSKQNVQLQWGRSFWAAPDEAATTDHDDTTPTTTKEEIPA